MQTPDQERKGRNLARTEIRNGATSPQSRRRHLGYGKKKNGYKRHWERTYERAARARTQADWEMGRNLANLEAKEKKSPRHHYRKIVNPNIKKGYWSQWARIALDRLESVASEEWKEGQAIAISEKEHGATSPPSKKSRFPLTQAARQGYEAQWAYYRDCQDNLPQIGRRDLTKWRPAGSSVFRRVMMGGAIGVGATLLLAAVTYGLLFSTGEIAGSPQRESDPDSEPSTGPHFVAIQRGVNGKCEFSASTLHINKKSTISFLSTEDVKLTFRQEANWPVPDEVKQYSIEGGGKLVAGMGYESGGHVINSPLGRQFVHDLGEFTCHFPGEPNSIGAPLELTGSR